MKGMSPIYLKYTILADRARDPKRLPALARGYHCIDIRGREATRQTYPRPRSGRPAHIKHSNRQSPGEAFSQALALGLGGATGQFRSPPTRRAEVISSPRRSARNLNAPSRHRLSSCAPDQGLQRGANIGRCLHQMTTRFKITPGSDRHRVRPGKRPWRTTHHKTTPTSPTCIAARTSMRGLPWGDREKAATLDLLHPLSYSTHPSA